MKKKENKIHTHSTGNSISVPNLKTTERIKKERERQFCGKLLFETFVFSFFISRYIFRESEKFPSEVIKKLELKSERGRRKRASR